MIKCVVFDVDGTLIDTGEAIIGSLQKVLREDLREEFSEEELTFAFGIPGAVTLEKLGAEDIDSSLDKWIKYLDEFSSSMRIFDGIEDCLKKIKALGLKTGIVTSKTKDEFECNFISFGLRGYFDFVVCADDTDKHKPDPEPMLKLMELCGCKNSEIVYIGDTKYDKECAEGAGVKFGLALWGAKSSKGFESAYILQNPCDILDFVAANQLPYEVERLENADIRSALTLVHDVFMEFDAPEYSEQGIKTFMDTIEYDAVMNRVEGGTLEFWVCRHEGKVVGVVAAKQKSHISLLFVDKNYHRKGIARRLFEEVLASAGKNPDIKAITVNSSPYAVEVYHRLGFIDVKPEQTVNGIRFIPMKYIII